MKLNELTCSDTKAENVCRPKRFRQKHYQAAFEKKYKNLLGIFVNPDEIEAQIKKRGFLDFKKYHVQTDQNEVLDYFRHSTLLRKGRLLSQVPKLQFDKDRLDFSEVKVNSYFASVASDLIRQKLLPVRESFSFETVMSSRDKIDFLRKSLRYGYRNYLYFIATDDPAINISRVEIRVKANGHDVPEKKIRSRYKRSLENLWDAIKLTNRAYIYDNSGEEAVIIAEITDAKTITIENHIVPFWFEKYVLDKI